MGQTLSCVVEAATACAHSFVVLPAGLAHLLNGCKKGGMLNLAHDSERDRKIHRADANSDDAVNTDNLLDVFDRLLRFDYWNAKHGVICRGEVCRVETIAASSSGTETAGTF